MKEAIVMVHEMEMMGRKSFFRLRYVIPTPKTSMRRSLEKMRTMDKQVMSSRAKSVSE